VSTFGRNFVPISESALAEIDAQAARTLRSLLSSRKFVDVNGPMGWAFAGVAVGRLRDMTSCESAVCSGVREVLPPVEARAPFELCLAEMHDVDRGMKDPDLCAVELAAAEAAKFEEDVIYNGHEKAGIKGLLGSSVNEVVSLPAGDHAAFVAALACVVGDMQAKNSIGGPYAIVGGAKLGAALRAHADGRSLLEAIKKTTEIDEYIYTPCHEEAFVVSKRGGDFELTLGMDFTVGYAGVYEKSVRFFLTESLTFRVLEPRAFTPVLLK